MEPSILPVPLLISWLEADEAQSILTLFIFFSPD